MASDATTLTDKQVAAEVLSDMPDTASLAEISDALAILAGLERARADLDAGRVVSNDEVKRRSREWTGR